MGSRVPEVIEALVALGKADPELEGVVVADGPEVTDTSAPEWLVVGFDGDPNGDFEAAQTVGGWSDLGTGREEEFQITVAAIAHRGDTDAVAARQRAYEIAARVEVWLRTQPNLGLASLEAAIGGTRLVQDQTEDGASARLLLSVAGRAFT
ncbi:hypothetical protein BX257_4738 [Streptomyces sp. 3212.3]|uniref:hypothetical protein n=1 Tax=Streptomyces sp. 3212.3 TaxID=1938846 RepID=UPI000E264458|nr:hypothetical protein [Streptomyces sp. 3212.3]REE62125.1 hypothetical protein BX257_4738 [Streptomyces sp. 3212.3]